MGASPGTLLQGASLQARVPMRPASFLSMFIDVGM